MNLLFWIGISCTWCKPLPDTLPLKDKVEVFPSSVINDVLYNVDEPFTIYYDNTKEKKNSIFGQDSFSIFLRFKCDDGQIYRVTNLISINSREDLLMKKIRDGLFRFSFIPKQIKVENKPESAKIREAIIQIIKIPYCGNSSCIVDGVFSYQFPCDR